MSSEKEDVMISREEFVKIKAMAAAGMYQKDIAGELGVDARTVRRAIARGDAPKRERQKRVSKLAPYHAQIDELMKRGVWNGAVILREIERAGYRGGRTVLREYMQPKRALRMRADRSTVRFETQAGQQLQSDWGQERVRIGGEECEAHFIANTLGYSRRFHFWCTDSEDAEHTYEGLIRTFEYVGGVTEEVLVDNQKAAVLMPRGSTGEAAVFQARFVDLAQLYGFEPKACRPYRARTKGKDERMVGYIKHNFFVRYREFDSWAHLNQLAEQWLREEADQRVHGTVKEVVAERFEREKGALKALPAQRYDTSYHEHRMAGWDGYVDVRGNRYSVPGELAGRPVRIRISLDGVLTIYPQDGQSAVAQHPLTSTPGVWITVANHHADMWAKALGASFGVERRALDVYQEVLA
jgi:transposase